MATVNDDAILLDNAFTVLNSSDINPVEEG